nr:MAG TPA: hypothetical protein [Caudoviricetes sp.]
MFVNCFVITNIVCIFALVKRYINIKHFISANVTIKN